MRDLFWSELRWDCGPRWCSLDLAETTVDSGPSLAETSNLREQASQRFGPLPPDLKTP